jgi:outer membrane biosynthesis protein TonB
MIAHSCRLKGSPMRALACLLALMVSTLAASQPALAQAEERGYGGPATVGPNFKTGNQSAPPDYGVKPPAKKKVVKPSAPPKPPKKVAKPKPPAKTPKTVAKPAAPREQTPSGETQDVAKSPPADESAPSAPAAATCRRFDATTGTTIEVACE